MLGNVIFQIFDVCHYLGYLFTYWWTKTLILKNRILYLLFDVALCIWGQSHWTLYRHSTSLNSHCNIDI